MSALAATLQEIADAILAVTSWSEGVVPNPDDPDDTTTHSYIGTAMGWVIVICDFALPDGGRGQDGGATKGARFMRLTRELAKAGVEAAKKAATP